MAPTSGPTRFRRLFLVLAATLSLLAAIAAATLTSALPVVFDVRPVVLCFATAAALLWLLVRTRTRTVRRRAHIAGALAVVYLSVAAWAAFDMTLAYRTREVTFQSGDVTLHGTLYLPRRAGLCPGVVLLHGSGRQTRDEGRFYARSFARRGFAALAFDKRGSGDSTGNVKTSTFQQFAADGVAAIELVRAQSEVDRKRVGIWGVSEAEWVGSLAARDADAAFLVIVSASAMTPSQQTGYETGMRVRKAGFGDAAAREAQTLYGKVSQYQRTGDGREALNVALVRAAKAPWFRAAWYLDESVPDYERVQAIDWFPAWKQRMDFDALPVLAAFHGPVLAQTGGADQKNDGAGAIERLRAAVDSGGSSRFTGILYPNAEHGIIEWRLPGRMPPPVFAVGYLDDQIAWMAKHSGLRRGGPESPR